MEVGLLQRNLRSIVRIAFLLLIVVMASGCWLFPVEEEREVVVHDMPSLREIYQDDFEIGVAVASASWSSKTLQNHAGLIKHHFSSLTAENEMKPDALQGHEGRFTYNDADQIVDFAVANDMKVRGHTLVWHAQTPDWFFIDEEGTPLTDVLEDKNLPAKKDPVTEEDRQLVIDRLENHIEEVMTYYGDKVYAWDLVNEAVTDDWRATHRDDSPWYDILGDEFMEIAFRKAHEVNPNAKLFYNDYNAIRDLKRAIEEYTALGIKEIHITELDVGLNGKTEDQQAKYYAELFKFFKEHSDVITSVTLWGVTDDSSWRSGENPLLFNAQGEPKPAFWAIVDTDKSWKENREEHIRVDTEENPLKNSFSSISNLFAEIRSKVADFVLSRKSVAFAAERDTSDGGKKMKEGNMGKTVKVPGYSNPLRDYKLGADPYAVVFEGRVYIYLSSDEYMTDAEGNLIENSFAQLNRVFVISSEDMVNWTDHGAIPVAGIHNANDGQGIAKWAGGSWAPAATHKKINGEDKFFLYFSNSAGSIGVLTADSPIGPWSDPLGEPLITHNTPGVRGVVWLFDPAVLVDDDGTGYLYFGGGLPGGRYPSQAQIANPKTARVIQLGDDMISTVGEAVTIDAPYMFEDAGIHKYNGRYYYSYCTNFGARPSGQDVPPAGEIAYMISDNPMGPFEYVTTVLKNPHHFFGVGGNNHHAFFEFNDQWYIVYHAQTVAKALLGDGKGYRSPHINEVEFDEDGYIKEIIGNRIGIAQLKNLDPYKRNEAETIAWNKGITTEVSGAPGGFDANPDLNLNVTNINDDHWIAVAGADFGEEGATQFQANVASTVGGTMEIRLGTPGGKLVGTLQVTPTGGDQKWELMETEVDKIAGVHNVFFVFKGENETNLFNFDYWQFK